MDLEKWKDRVIKDKCISDKLRTDFCSECKLDELDEMLCYKSCEIKKLEDFWNQIQSKNIDPKKEGLRKCLYCGTEFLSIGKCYTSFCNAGCKQMYMRIYMRKRRHSYSTSVKKKIPCEICGYKKLVYKVKEKDQYHRLCPNHCYLFTKGKKTIQELWDEKLKLEKSNCEICGYTEILEIHHEWKEDGSYTLHILCPNHHGLITRGIKTLEELKK